jgi:hypothetical protein
MNAMRQQTFAVVAQNTLKQRASGFMQPTMENNFLVNRECYAIDPYAR